jgi:hypothetical protein
MADLMDMISQAMGGDTVKQMSRQLGTNEQSTGTAISAALPLLLSALAKNSGRPEGASALHQALNNDHDGSVLDDLPALLDNPQAGPGAGILRHVLGDRQDVAQQALAKTSGMDAGSANQLMTMLAPIVMGALGRAQRQQGLDAGGLGSLLQSERQGLKQSTPGAMGLVTKLLDKDGDGSVLDDIGGMVGKLMGGR